MVTYICQHWHRWWLGAIRHQAITYTNVDFSLTHWGRVTHICVGKQTIIGSDNGLSPGRRQAFYLNQCRNIVNWNLGNKLQWKFIQNSNIFIQENAFENVVRKLVAILPQPQCVNGALWHSAEINIAAGVWWVWKLYFENYCISQGTMS